MIVNTYFIKWKEPDYDDETGKRFSWTKKQKIIECTTEELNKFIKGKQKIKINQL